MPDTSKGLVESVLQWVRAVLETVIGKFSFPNVMADWCNPLLRPSPEGPRGSSSSFIELAGRHRRVVTSSIHLHYAVMYRCRHSAGRI